MDRLRAIAAKIIADYKKHYDFPWQGESHMEDCIMGNLQSLSQEAVRDEVLEVALRKAADTLADAARTFRVFGKHTAADAMRVAEDASRAALKREPNAAAGPIGGWMPPAPAAPDVASMVEKLNSLYHGVRSRIDQVEGLTIEDALVAKDAAALLAKLGQGWIPVKFNMTNYPVARHLGEWDTIDRKREDGKIFRFTLPPLPGASDD